MNFENITIAKKILLILLVLITVASLGLLTYAMVYAKPESAYRKYALVIGIVFIAVGRTTWAFISHQHAIQNFKIINSPFQIEYFGINTNNWYF